jgi:hypothetical protein
MLKGSLADLPPVDRLLLIPLLKKYTEYSLAKGVDALTYSHRKQYEAIKAATDEGWKIRIITAKLMHSFHTGYYAEQSYSSPTTSIQKIFDEEGNDITTEEKKWLSKTLNFDSAIDMGGMVLADPFDDYAEIWGPSVCIHRSNDYDSEGDGRTTRVHTASFILGKPTRFLFCSCHHYFISAN